MRDPYVARDGTEYCVPEMNDRGALKAIARCFITFLIGIGTVLLLAAMIPFIPFIAIGKSLTSLDRWSRGA